MKYIPLFAILTILIIAGCTTQLNEQSNDTQEKMPALESKEGTNDPSSGLEVEEEDESDDDDLDKGNSNTNPITQPVGATSNTLSLSDLSQHNSESDCWVAYQGKVYDVTVFLSLHPGGVEKILKYCGTASEFETGFTKKHGTSKVNILLQQIYKGDLA
jgi:cytochrome b involved in lipid metabolism